MRHVSEDKKMQAERFQLTVNNPDKYNYSHKYIKEILTTKFKTIQYFCMADECGETYHTHVFICFSSRVRWNTIKKYFNHAHIEAVKSGIQVNIEYIKKTGKWLNDKKRDTSIEGTFEEWGEIPPENKGKSKEMEELYHMILDGWTNAEIIRENQDYIFQIDKLDKLRTMLLTEKYRGTRRLNIEVIYVFGVTGSGKSRSILDENGDSNVYRITDYQHPFDGYNCQSVIVFEEFRSSLMIKDMLNYLDIYPLELPARYINKFACYIKVYIVSNWTLEMQYVEVQQKDIESWKAFLRRIHKVKQFTEQGIITYNSIKEYLQREMLYEDVTEEEQKNNPFV